MGSRVTSLLSVLAGASAVVLLVCGLLVSVPTASADDGEVLALPLTFCLCAPCPSSYYPDCAYYACPDLIIPCPPGCDCVNEPFFEWCPCQLFI